MTPKEKFKRIKTPKTLSDYGLTLTENELRKFDEGREFLLKIRSAYNALAGPAKQAAAGLIAFGDAYYRMAEKSYKYHHGRLPGSRRTKRLRKKRKMSVLKWFAGPFPNPFPVER